MCVMYETTECIRPADVHLRGKSSHIDASDTLRAVHGAASHAWGIRAGRFQSK